MIEIKLWIIYYKGIGFSKIVSEMLQERLEDYIDVFVGDLENISPTSLIEEKLDFLIIGDVVCMEDLGEEIKNWISKFLEISKNRSYYLKTISGFYVNTTNSKDIPSWVEYLRKNLKTTKLFPPIVELKLNVANFTLDSEVSTIINKYSKIFIEYLLNK